MLSLKLVPVTLNHLDQFQRISVTTFKETFADQNTNDDIKHYLKVNMSSNKLKKELSNPNCEFYFAYCNKILGGYLKLNFKNAQREDVLENKGFEIERFYLLKSFQGKGFGKKLFQKTIDIGRSKGYKKLWLGVWENNKSAIKFYEKLNLKIFDKHTFILGNDIQTDFLMKLNF